MLLNNVKFIVKNYYFHDSGDLKDLKTVHFILVLLVFQINNMKCINKIIKKIFLKFNFK